MLDILQCCCVKQVNASQQCWGSTQPSPNHDSGVNKRILAVIFAGRPGCIIPCRSWGSPHQRHGSSPLQGSQIGRSVLSCPVRRAAGGKAVKVGCRRVLLQGGGGYVGAGSLIGGEG